MDPLELSYDNMNAVPEAYRGLYQEQDGKAVFNTGMVSGMKTQQDVSNVQEALRKERTDHALAKESLKPWASLGKTYEEITTSLDRIAELEAAAGGKLDEAAINKLVETRIGSKTAPLERQIREATESLNTVTRERDEARGAIARREMSDAVRSVATEMKVVPTAIADVELFAQMALERQEDGTYLTKQGVPGVTPGLDVKAFLKDMQKQRPHWWPASQGGGAGGSGGGQSGDNPWSKTGWNLTKQGQFIREHGKAQADIMAQSAGVFVGATKPLDK